MSPLGAKNPGRPELGREGPGLSQETSSESWTRVIGIASPWRGCESVGFDTAGGAVEHRSEGSWHVPRHHCELGQGPTGQCVTRHMTTPVDINWDEIVDSLTPPRNSGQLGEELKARIVAREVIRVTCTTTRWDSGTRRSLVTGTPCCKLALEVGGRIPLTCLIRAE